MHLFGFGFSQNIFSVNIYNFAQHPLLANNESSEVCGHLLPVTYLIEPFVYRLDNATNF